MIHYTHIVGCIRNVVHEVGSAAANTIRGAVNKLKRSKVQFTGGATSEVMIIDSTSNTTTIPITIVPSQHHHTPAQFTDGVMPEANTAVKRDNVGNIRATSYLLADARDISAVFMSRELLGYSINYVDIGTGNALQDCKISISGRVITMTRTYADICVCYT